MARIFKRSRWNDLAHEVRRLAAGLRRAGLQPGDRIVQVSENRYEWILVDLAVHLARGVHVAVHSRAFGTADCLSNCRQRGAIGRDCFDAEQVGKACGRCRIRLPRGLQFFSYEPIEAEIAGQPVSPFTELFAAHRQRRAAESIVQEALRSNQARRPGDDSLHVRHDRRSKRRDAQSRESDEQCHRDLQGI